jgi:hypothetical protein
MSAIEHGQALNGWDILWFLAVLAVWKVAVRLLEGRKQ